MTAKKKKDQVFREIEQMKTNIRLIEKQGKGQTGVIKAPFKLEVTVLSGSVDPPEDCQSIQYRIDNGKDYLFSEKIEEVRNPCWMKSQSINLNSSQTLFFQIIADTGDGEDQFDSFEFSEEDLMSRFKKGREF